MAPCSPPLRSMGVRIPGVFRCSPLGLPALALLLALPLTAQAQPTPEGGAGLFKTDGFWIRGSLGGFDNNPEPQLPGQRAHSSMSLSLGVELRRAPLSVELEIVGTSRKFDTEGGAFIIVVDDETSVETVAYTLGGRVTLPPAGPVRAYGSAGLGLVHTTFRTDATLFGLPGTAQEQSDTAFRPVVGGGVQVVFGRWAVQADYRRFGVDGSFPEYEIESVDLGGSVLMFGLGYRVRLPGGQAAGSS